MFDSPIERHQEQKKSMLVWWLLAATLVVVIGLPLYVTFGPNPPIVVSKATTHITAPLDADDLPDYAAALLAKMRSGVNPDTNAAISLLEALWPEGDDVYDPADAQLLLAELGMSGAPPTELRIANFWGKPMRYAALDLYRQRVPRPEDRGEAPTEEVHEFGADSITISSDTVFWDATDEQASSDYRVDNLLDLTLGRSWTADDLPFAAQWMDDNRVGLDRLRRAAQKANCYFPDPELIRGGSGRCSSSSFQSLTLHRRAARYLNLLANRSLGEGQVDQAASDAIAILQVARHAGRGPFLTDRLVATAVAGIGMETIQRIAGDAAMPPATLRRLLKDLERMPPVNLIDGRVLLGERYYALDQAITSSRDGVPVVDIMEAATNHVTTLANRTSVDWNRPLIAINGYYDQLDAAFKQPVRKGRDDALRALVNDVQVRGAAAAAVWDHPGRLVTPEGRGDVVADAFVSSFAFGYDLVFMIEERDRTQRALTRLAIALAIHRAEQGDYPTLLEALTPGILAEEPTDLFHGRPFVYRRTEDGCLLYSCGPNGIDDRGSNEGSEGAGIGSPTFEGVAVEDWFDASSNQLTAEEQAAYDLIEQIPAGADDHSLRIPLPVDPWPWEPQ